MPCFVWGDVAIESWLEMQDSSFLPSRRRSYRGRTMDQTCRTSRCRGWSRTPRGRQLASFGSECFHSCSCSCSCCLVLLLGLMLVKVGLERWLHIVPFRVARLEESWSSPMFGVKYRSGLLSDVETVENTLSISFNNFLPISEVADADQKIPSSFERASHSVWNCFRDRVRCKANLLWRISRYAILIDRDIAYGTKGKSVGEWSSQLMVELIVAVERLCRRYDALNRCGSAQLLERQERIATAW